MLKAPRQFLPVFIFFLFLSGTASPAIINVPADQPTIQDGIYAASEGDSIGENTISSCTDNGIDIDRSIGCTIHGNTCNSSNAETGIRLYGTDSNNTCKYNTVIGNTCTNNYVHGIYLEGYSKRNTVFGNNCVNNESDDIKEDSYNNGAEKNIFANNLCAKGGGGELTPGVGTNSIIANNGEYSTT